MMMNPFASEEVGSSSADGGAEEEEEAEEADPVEREVARRVGQNRFEVF